MGLERIHWVGIHPEKAMCTNVNTIVIIDDKRYYHSNYAKDNVRKKRELRVYKRIVQALLLLNGKQRHTYIEMTENQSGLN